MVETQLGKPNPIFDPLTTFYSCCTWECFVKASSPHSGLSHLKIQQKKSFPNWDSSNWCIQNSRFQMLLFFRSLKIIPREVVPAPNLPEFRKNLDNSLRHYVIFGVVLCRAGSWTLLSLRDLSNWGYFGIPRILWASNHAKMPNTWAPCSINCSDVNIRCNLVVYGVQCSSQNPICCPNSPVWAAVELIIFLKSGN